MQSGLRGWELGTRGGVRVGIGMGGREAGIRRANTVSPSLFSTTKSGESTLGYTLRHTHLRGTGFLCGSTIDFSLDEETFWTLAKASLLLLCSQPSVSMCHLNTYWPPAFPGLSPFLPSFLEFIIVFLQICITSQFL